MKGALVIAHGSRATETEATFDAILSMVAAKLPGTFVQCAFMGNSDRTVEKGIEALAAKGVTEIKVVPYFLFKGIHIKEDIPRLVAKYSESFPQLKITMGEHLGVDERLADVLVDRIGG